MNPLIALLWRAGYGALSLLVVLSAAWWYGQHQYNKGQRDAFAEQSKAAQEAIAEHARNDEVLKGKLDEIHQNQTAVREHISVVAGVQLDDLERLRGDIEAADRRRRQAVAAAARATQASRRPLAAEGAKVPDPGPKAGDRSEPGGPTEDDRALIAAGAKTIGELQSVAIDAARGAAGAAQAATECATRLTEFQERYRAANEAQK